MTGDGCTLAGVLEVFEWSGRTPLRVHARSPIDSFVRTYNTNTRAHTHQLTDRNKIGDQGAAALAAALEQNATLEDLYLGKMIPCVVEAWRVMVSMYHCPVTRLARPCALSD